MRKYGYNRPSATLYKRRRARAKKPSFFLRFIFLLFVLVGIGWGGFIGVRYGYFLIKDAQVSDWHVKSISISGVNGTIEQKMRAKALMWKGKPFSFEQAENLRKEFIKTYPMLKHITVARGLLTGKLKISAKPREPVALLVLPDGRRQYIDLDCTLYTDSNGPDNVPPVQLIGPVPEKLQSGVVEMIQSVLKLKKSLPFEAFQLNLQDNTVSMQLPDESVIHFGKAHDLKAKALRAAQIMENIRGKYQVPITLNFEFFEQGKVFLTLSAH